MSDYVSANVNISEPPMDTPTAHADLMGFAFNIDIGIFIPRTGHELLNELPYLEPYEGTNSGR